MGRENKMLNDSQAGLYKKSRILKQGDRVLRYETLRYLAVAEKQIIDQRVVSDRGLQLFFDRS